MELTENTGRGEPEYTFGQLHASSPLHTKLVTLEVWGHSSNHKIACDGKLKYIVCILLTRTVKAFM